MLRLLQGKVWMEKHQNCGTNTPSWDDTLPGVRCCAPFFLSCFLLAWTGSAFSAHPDVLSPDAFDHISATVNRSVPPPPEISWHIKAPEGGLILECTIKMWDPYTHSRTLVYFGTRVFLFQNENWVMTDRSKYSASAKVYPFLWRVWETKGIHQTEVL